LLRARPGRSAIRATTRSPIAGPIDRPCSFVGARGRPAPTCTAPPPHLPSRRTHLPRTTGPGPRRCGGRPQRVRVCAPACTVPHIVPMSFGRHTWAGVHPHVSWIWVPIVLWGRLASRPYGGLPSRRTHLPRCAPPLRRLARRSDTSGRCARHPLQCRTLCRPRMLLGSTVVARHPGITRPGTPARALRDQARIDGPRNRRVPFWGRVSRPYHGLHRSSGDREARCCAEGRPAGTSARQDSAGDGTRPPLRSRQQRRRAFSV
jgi:hypothetical protein